VPFVIPASISCDHATTMDVINHAINWSKEHEFDVAMLAVFIELRILFQVTQ
jgi:hypothetical protein